MSMFYCVHHAKVEDSDLVGYVETGRFGTDGICQDVADERPELRTFTFSSKDRWIVVAALEKAQHAIAQKGDAMHWQDDPDLGPLHVTIAVATRVRRQEDAA